MGFHSQYNGQMSGWKITDGTWLDAGGWRKRSLADTKSRWMLDSWLSRILC